MPRPTRDQTTATATATATKLRLAAAGAVALAILAGLVGASGCTRTTDAAAPTGPATSPSAGPTPTVDATPGQADPSQDPPDQAQPEPAGGGDPAGPAEDPPAEGGASFPDTPEAYADEVVTAWQTGDLDRLGQLASAQVHEQIIEIPATPAQGWTDPWCDGTAGSSYCHQYSQPTPENLGSGEALTLRIRHDLLGQPAAVVEVSYAELDFPTAWEDYVFEFISAWHSDDYDRLRQLATPQVVSYAVTAAPPIHPILDEVGGGGGLLQVTVTNEDGFHRQLDIGTTKLGGPQAIIGHSS